MNFGNLKSCICNLESRIREIEENGGGGGGGGCVAEYDLATVYSPGNMVCYEGGVYVALQTTDGYTPTNDGVVWYQVGALDNFNVWHPDLEYPASSIVYHDGGLWYANTTANPGDEPGVDLSWDALIGPAGPAGPQGDPGEIGLHAFVEAPTAKTYVLALYAGVACTIDTLVAKTVSGTCTVNIRINGVSVTGLSAVAVSSVESSTNSSGANSVAVGDTIDFVVSSVSSPVDLQLSILIS
jgi:hypothetical protein